MNDKKQPAQNGEQVVSPPVFWGTIALAGIILFISGFAIVITFSSGIAATSYIGILVVLPLIALGGTSIVFTVRRRQDIGFGIAYSIILLLAAAITLYIQGRVVQQTFLVLSVGIIGIRWLCPPRWQRRFVLVTAFVLILMWAVEALNPAWRIQLTSAQAGPQVGIWSAVLFGIVFFVFVIRQAFIGNLRTKLIAAFLLVAIIPLGIVFYINYRSTTQNLTNSAHINVNGAAAQAASALDNFFINGLNDVRISAQTHILSEYLTLPSAERAGSETEVVLYRDLRAISRRDQTYITSVGLIDKNGLSIADTAAAEVGVDKSGRDYFFEPLKTKLPYVSPVNFSLVSNDLSLYFSAPVRDDKGEIIGVLRIRYNATVIQSIIKNAAQESKLDALTLAVLDENHIRLADSVEPGLILKSIIPLSADKITQLQAERRLPSDASVEQIAANTTNNQALENGLNNLDKEPFFIAEFHDTTTGDDEGTAVQLKNQPWLVAAGQNREVFLTPLNAQTRTATFTLLIMAVLVAFAALWVAQTIANPIVRLTDVAQKIAGGEVTLQAKVDSQDEIGLLAGTFNQMTTQLRDLIGSLEQRVADRTKDLETVAEVGAATATILETKKLLQAVVDLTKERFNLYHSHIYLLDNDGKNLVLAAGAGEPGRIMVAEKRSIPLDREQSLVARAARERQGVTVNDVTQTPDFLPNPLLPGTRSELAVPMIAGGNVIGVFDIQSDQVGRFTESDVNIQTTLASQVATSIQNVRSFEQAKSQADLESLVNAIGQKIQRATSVEDTLQTAIREIGLALGAARVSANIQAVRQNDDNNSSHN